MMPEDPYDLRRFVEAQAPIYTSALDELRAGTKRTHWMWFVFPQLAGLGRSPTAVRYAIASLDEARAYLAHDILGPRLREATEAVVAVEGRSAHQIFGSPDDMKFRSSMTLFSRAAPGEALFEGALGKYFGSRADEATLELLGG